MLIIPNKYIVLPKTGRHKAAFLWFVPTCSVEVCGAASLAAALLNLVLCSAWLKAKSEELPTDYGTKTRRKPKESYLKSGGK